MARTSISGMGRLMRQLRELPSAARETRSEVLHEWADDTEAQAEQLAPVRTGHLKRSVEQRVHDGRGVAYVGVWQRSALEYARYVEEGTSSMPDQPFLVPAFEMTRRRALASYRRRLLDRLGRLR